MTGGGDALREAAVLVPVYRDREGDLTLVMIRRADVGAHGGQIAFPGGKRDRGDATALETALREAREEIGLEPKDVAVIAALDRVETRSTGFVIAPFLARIRRPERWRPDPAEVEEVLEVRVRDLALPEARGESFETFPGSAEPSPIPFYRLAGHRLWGASYRIVHPLVPRLLSSEWPV